MIKNLEDLNKVSEKNWEKYLNREKHIENKIKELTEKKQKLRYSSGLRELFKPFAEKIKNKLKASAFVWYGPFGLFSEQTVYFLKDEKNLDICKKGNVLGSICFINNGIRDERENIQKYEKGTIGELNGMNYSTIAFNKEMNLKWLINWAKRNR